MAIPGQRLWYIVRDTYYHPEAGMVRVGDYYKSKTKAERRLNQLRKENTRNDRHYYLGFDWICSLNAVADGKRPVQEVCQLSTIQDGGQHASAAV